MSLTKILEKLSGFYARLWLRRWVIVWFAMFNAPVSRLVCHAVDSRGYGLFGNVVSFW